MMIFFWYFALVACELHPINPQNVANTFISQWVTAGPAVESTSSDLTASLVTNVPAVATGQPVPLTDTRIPYRSRYLCGLELANGYSQLNDIYHTQTTFPLTFTALDQEIPVTFAADNYVYKLADQPVNIFHTFHLKIINSPFTGIYKMFVPTQPFESFYQINQNTFNNLEGTLNHTYSCSQTDSCLLTGLLQYQLIFADLDRNGKQEKDYNFYDFYIGNCDDTQVQYNQFNDDVSTRCIPFNLLCLSPDSRCSTGDAPEYLPFVEPNLQHFLTQDGPVHATGYFPDPSFDACRRDEGCDYLKTTSSLGPLTTASQTENFAVIQTSNMWSIIMTFVSLILI